MFKELAPLVAERNIHLVLASGSDGKIVVYIEPAKKDEKEPDAFITPLRLPPSDPADLDAQLATILTDWIAARTSVTQTLQAALEESKTLMEKNAADAKKAAADKAAKKPAVTPAAKVVVKVPPNAAAVIAAPTPSLLDDAAPVAPVSASAGAEEPADDEDAPSDEVVPVVDTPAIVAAPAAATVTMGEEGVTVPLF